MASELDPSRAYQIIKWRFSRQRPRSADPAQSDPMSLRRSQRIEQLLHPHPPSEIPVYEPSPDNTVSPDDKCSGYRQDPGIVALIIGKRSTIRGQQSLKIGPDPDGKVKR